MKMKRRSFVLESSGFRVLCLLEWLSDLIEPFQFMPWSRLVMASGVGTAVLFGHVLLNLYKQGCEVLDCHVPPKPLLSDTFRLDALSQGPKRSQRAQQKLSRITSLLMELKLQVLGVDGNGFSLRIPDDLLGWELYRRLCLRLPDKPGAIPVLCMKDSKLDLAITLRETLRPSAPTEPYRAPSSLP